VKGVFGGEDDCVNGHGPIAFWKKCSRISEFKRSGIKRMIDLLQPENQAGIFFEDGVS